MLNYNKIASDINKKNTPLTAIARKMGIAYTSFKDRYDRHKLYADEIEGIADYFGRSIAYYFDREEKEQPPLKVLKTEEVINVVEEPPQGWICPVCATKDKLIASYEKQIYLLEFSLGKIKDAR